MDKETKRILYSKVLSDFPMIIDRETVVDALLRIDEFTTEEIDAIVKDTIDSETAMWEDKKREAEEVLAEANSRLDSLKVIK